MEHPMAFGSSGASIKGEIREAQCAVLCVAVRGGVSAEEGYLVRDALNGADTIGWWFLNPGTFIAVFAGGRSPPQAAACACALRELLARNAPGAKAGVAVREGPVLGSFTCDGILETLPVGGIVTAAMREAADAAA
jgi:hypothetical protein